MKKPLALHELPPVEITKACAESQSKAVSLLTLEALSMRESERGDAAFGDVKLSADEMFLRQVEATGTVHVRGLGQHLQSIWADEARLNRLLIRVGRALAATGKRRHSPDWRHVNQATRFIVEGWTKSIIVDGQRWPQLCRLTTPALRRFLKLVKQPGASMSSPAFRQMLHRLGLVSLRKGKIKHVEKRGGRLLFS